jgi:hypothetical protein
LPRQQHGVAVGVVGPNDSGIAVVVHFALALYLAVAPALFESHAQQLALVAGNRLDLPDVHRLAIHLHGLFDARERVLIQSDV